MSADLTPQELLEVQEYFSLPSPVLVEKDYYVTRALAAITSADTEPFSLVFGGGTSLCRAHRIIKRMSEDIDLKVVCEHEPKRPELRRLRECVTDALRAAGFVFDPNNREHRDSRNETRYTIFRLPYAPVLQGEGILRPEIQIELTVSALHCPSVALPLHSFVAEAYGRPPEVKSLACVSVTQTLAEKFVSLTRRTAAEIADATHAHDPTLIRHIYDLHVTGPHYDLAEIATLIQEVMKYDALQFGNQSPDYRDDPLTVTRATIAAFQSDPVYAQRYEDFLRNMVYGEAVDFASCLSTLESLAQHI